MDISGTSRVKPELSVMPPMFSGGSTWAPSYETGLVARTSLGSVVPMEPEPVIAADASDVETLLNQHLQRMDGVYARLSK